MAHPQHIHILGICGTFMGGLALLAREMGFQVSGSDAGVYPPMSTQLEQAGIVLHEGYSADAFESEPDCVVIGNAMSRGNPAVEHVLSRGLRYTSGPQFLAEHILPGKWVLAVAGTHGKTTTASMLAHILERAGMSPGFLIGGVAEDFMISARLGETPFFVVEADEYDTAFFDKRSKFVHYHPRTLILNNLEFDHADIFADLAAIQTQFHHLLRTVPENGLILQPSDCAAMDEVIAMGCWTPREQFDLHNNQGGWSATNASANGHHFGVQFNAETVGQVEWSHSGEHNINNALAAIGAAHHVGVTVEHATEALASFKGVKRRMELRGEVNGVRVFDDFAHHPTAIATTLAGAKQCLRNKGKLIAVLEPRSNTMRMGVHRDTLAPALSEADSVHLFIPENIDWSLQEVTTAVGEQATSYQQVDDIVAALVQQVQADDDIVVMSNGAFGAVHDKLLIALKNISEKVHA